MRPWRERPVCQNPRPLPAWAGGALTGVAGFGLAVWLWAMDLETASQVSGVLGLFASLAGVAVSVVSVRQQRAAAADDGQSVRDSTIGHGVVQVSGVQGDVRIVHRGPGGAVARPPEPPSDGVAPAGPAASP